MEKTPITNEEIDAKRTPAGGWKRAQLAEWGVPWPAPKGWRKQIVKHGYPYDPALDDCGDVTRYSMQQLERMVNNSEPHLIDGAPMDCEGELDIDPVKLLRKVVSAVISADRADILWEFPDVLAFFGSRIPDREELAGHSNVDERMFEAKSRWPNLKKDG
jgi:hypothetical protein